MKKTNDFRVLSNVVCSVPDCEVHVKQNLVDRKKPGKPLMCFKHFMARVRKHPARIYDKFRSAVYASAVILLLITVCLSCAPGKPVKSYDNPAPVEQEPLTKK